MRHVLVNGLEAVTFEVKSKHQVTVYRGKSEWLMTTTEARCYWRKLKAQGFEKAVKITCPQDMLNIVERALSRKEA